MRLRVATAVAAAAIAAAAGPAGTAPRSSAAAAEAPAHEAAGESPIPTVAAAQADGREAPGPASAAPPVVEPLGPGAPAPAAPAPAAKAAAGPACPVPLLEVVPRAGGAVEDNAAADGGSQADGDGQAEGLKLDERGLSYLASLKSPLYVVPALGVYRGGKSLVLNRLMGLKAPYAGGFGVGHGQRTFTRGVEICAEEVDGLGTVVWMDTEGLFSSEDARSAYGPKIFSLALLFSSSVLLNSVKVLNDQFFAFFAEQQQVTRVLKQGLAAQGLPQEALLPGNLSLFWVLQQPIHFDGSGNQSRAQLETFLTLPGDESRARVRRDFKHMLHEVPAASHDIRTWGRLDALPDEELLPDYVQSTAALRSAFLDQLRAARPMQAAGVAVQLRMYVELVQTERFSGALAKEAFEEAEIGTLCGAYAQALADQAGPLPVPSLGDIFEVAQRELEPRRVEVAEAYHLGSDWSRRLDRCLRSSEGDLLKRNADAVLAEWRAAAGAIAEEGGCFFLGRLARLLRAYTATYGAAFGAEVQAQAVGYASALQRTRLVECVRLRDFLWPLAPWLLWPFCSIYLRGGLLSGLIAMALHVVGAAGVYVLLQMLHQLPPYLDVDYPVLRQHTVLLDLVMRAPPFIPWASMARAFGMLGAARSAWKMLRCLAELSRPAGHGRTVGQMVNLELKMNVLLRRAEAGFKHQFAAAALDAARRASGGDCHGAAAALVGGLRLVAEVGEDDIALAAMLDAQLRRRARDFLRRGAPLTRPLGPGTVAPPPPDVKRLERLAVCGDWGGLLGEMLRLSEVFARQRPIQAQPDSKVAFCASVRQYSSEGRRRRAAPPSSPGGGRRAGRSPTSPASPAFRSPAPGRTPPKRRCSPGADDAGGAGARRAPALVGGAGVKAAAPALEGGSATEGECEPEPSAASGPGSVSSGRSPPCSPGEDPPSPPNPGSEEGARPEDGAPPRRSLWAWLVGRPCVGAGAADGAASEDEAAEDEVAEDEQADGEEAEDEDAEWQGDNEAMEDHGSEAGGSVSCADSAAEEGALEDEGDGDVGEESEEDYAEDAANRSLLSKAAEILRVASAIATGVALSAALLFWGLWGGGGAAANGPAAGLGPRPGAMAAAGA